MKLQEYRLKAGLSKRHGIKNRRQDRGGLDTDGKRYCVCPRPVRRRYTGNTQRGLKPRSYVSFGIYYIKNTGA